MSMKPDTWRAVYNNGMNVGVWYSGEPDDNVKRMLVDHDGRTSIETAFAAATIRKWLEEAPSEEMVHAGLIIMEGDGALTSVSEVFEAMIAVKLKELG